MMHFMNLEFKYDCEAQQWWSRRRAEEEMGEGEGCCVGGGVTKKIFSDGNIKPSAAFWANPVSSSFLFGPQFVFFFCGFFEGRPVVF